MRNERNEELLATLGDDDQLLAALREAMREREAVPAWFVETGKNAYAWHNIDAELAQLTYDSHSDERMATATRSETASIRALTFSSAQRSIELEVTEDSLLGQIIPPMAGTLEIDTTAGTMTTTVDELGLFAVEPKPDSSFRLRWRTPDGADVITGWITV
ncbi:MAG TPA: hypothetical protein VFP81_09765 [Propionibacteriaceae bacterium]|nr:hypothetical protein [Propionibacteriaceae bacterium]